VGDCGDRTSQSHRGRRGGETVHLVVAPLLEELKSHRLTLTLPVLNHGAEGWYFPSADR
jgi:hypothetical protein